MELTWFARAVVYSRTRLLRALRLLPAVLAVSLALVLLLGLFAASALSGYRLGTDQQGVRLGFVTEGEDHYVELGLRTLETLDQARFAIVPVRCTEAEAADLLRRGEISAYLVAPEGFSEALMAGENRPLRFVYGDGAVDLGSMLMDELVQTAGKLLLETENAVFGAQEYAAEHIPGQNPFELGDRLGLEIIGMMLARKDLYETETLGVGAGLRFADYYLCAMPVLFLLLFGLLSAPLFRREELQARRLLSASGFGAFGQILCEYLAYACFTLLCSGLLLGLAALIAVAVPGWNGAAFLHYPARLFYPALSLAALHLLLHELGSGSVGALLLQFLVSAAMGFSSGCFYPTSMLPAGMQALGRWLPSGAAMAYMAKPGMQTALLPMAWLLLLLTLAWLIRRRGLERSGV